MARIAGGVVLALGLVGGCSYTVTDDQRLADIVARQNAQDGRISTLEQRVQTQGDELLRLRRLGGLVK